MELDLEIPHIQVTKSEYISNHWTHVDTLINNADFKLFDTNQALLFGGLIFLCVFSYSRSNNI